MQRLAADVFFFTYSACVPGPAYKQLLRTYKVHDALNFLPNEYRGLNVVYHDFKITFISSLFGTGLEKRY